MQQKLTWNVNLLCFSKTVVFSRLFYAFSIFDVFLVKLKLEHITTPFSRLFSHPNFRREFQRFLTDFNRGCGSIGSSRNFRMSMSYIDRTQVHIVLMICLTILSWSKTDFLRRRCWSSSVAGYWAPSSASWAWALSIVPVELVHGEILRCLKKPPRQTKEQKKSVELSFDTCLLGQSDHKKHILELFDWP